MLKKKDYSKQEIAFLITECQKGNRKAQFEIYNRYSKAMYNTSLRILSNSFDAEDAMQESFISAFDKMNSYEGNVAFGAWLKKIVVNKSIDYVRAKKTQLNALEKLKEQSDQEEVVEDDDHIQTDIYKIKKNIHKLPEGYRIILNLYLIEGYDHEEIAQILEISSSTSRSQFVRAKQKLLKLLNDSE